AKKCPDKTIAILERRENMGGTWDLFKYPGIRSDSDMASFGFRFKPWLSSKVLAKGGDIRDYVIETAREYGLKDKVQFGLKIIKSEWSSDDQHWKLTALHEASGEEKHFTCGFLSNCTGYYNFDEGYSPEFAGSDDFKGKIIHPQHWPEDLDYSGKKVVVIGSGATAVTLIPSMSDKTEHITMLQRSPTYIMPLPDNDTMAVIMNKFLPQNWVFKFARLRNTLFQRGLYLSAMRWPKVIRKLLLGAAKKRLGDGVDMRHFTPKYNPWEERLCAAPDGDLFECVKSGKASVVTDHIDRFTEKGILLKSGTELEADIIVTATGLNIQMMGGMDVAIDGKKTSIAEKMVYKSVLIEDFPNFAWIFGYTNVPWTLKSDIAGQYICRLFKHMDANNLKTVTPI
ncbi:FAD-containing monooxygenase EthA, partial [Oleiphilus sp. HI0079]